ncbi:MAG: hypothetical protein MUF13_10655 [Akkermansiaceae bacterium]|nr:hypothetical protein [Akkermansiaceae bacterium]
MKRWILILCFLTSAGLHADPAVQFRISPDRPTMEAPGIREASGIVVSRKDPGHYWIINDSGAPAEIHLVQADGTPRGKITLKDARNVDWEDLAIFEWDNQSWLLVADTGDNESKRDFCTLHILREPALPKPDQKLDARLTTDWQIRFRYEGGPRDCESVAVDAAARKILLLSKRNSPPELHELPLLKPEKRGIQTTRRIGTSTVDAPLESTIPFRNQPTAMDIAADQSFAAVLTYYGVFVFPKAPAESWPEAFARKPLSPGPHLLAQAESIAISADGKRIIALSEGKKTPIVTYQR